LILSWQERVNLCVDGGRAGGFAVEGYVDGRATETGDVVRNPVDAVCCNYELNPNIAIIHVAL